VPERAEIAPTVGRVLAFVALLIACNAAAYAFLAPLVRWVIITSGQPLRLEVFPELIAALAASAIMVWSIDRRPWSSLDLHRAAARPRLLSFGWLTGGMTIGAACAVLFVAGLLRFRASPGDGSWLGAAGRISLVLIPAALAEELMCRGYLLTVIRECVGERWAIVLTSVLFGVLHLQNPDATAVSVVVVVLAGVMLAGARVVGGSLYAAWMAHLAWNWVMAVLLHSTVSGLRFEAPGYFAEATGPSWLSGGSWGPEGGLVAATGLVVTIVLLSRRRREESLHDG